MNGNSLNLKFVLEAVDRLTAPTRRISESMKGAFGLIRSNVGFMGFAVQYHLYHARKALSEFGESLKQTGKNISEIGKGLMSKVSVPLIGIGGFSLRSAGQVERLTMQFRRLTGDAGKAEEIVKRLQGYKAFDMTDATEAMKAFLSAGYSTESAFKRMDFLGEIASGSGNQLSALTDMYINLRKNGKASAEDISGMMRANIPIATELAKQMGVSEQRIYQMASVGLISFSRVKKAMQDMAGEGGRFAGSMDEVSKDINGTFSDLRRSLSEGLAPLGREIWQKLELGDRLRALGAGVRDLVDSFVKLPEPVKSVIIYAGLAAVALGPVLFVVGQLITGLGALAAGFALLMSPVTLVVAALAGFAAAGYMLVKNWSKVKSFFIDLWQGIKSAFMDAIKPITDLIDSMTASVTRMIGRLSSIKSALTDNGLTRAWEKYFGNDPASAAQAAPAQNVGGGTARVDTGGTLDINVNQEGQVTGVAMRPNDRRQNVNVNTGSLAWGY